MVPISEMHRCIHINAAKLIRVRVDEIAASVIQYEGWWTRGRAFVDVELPLPHAEAPFHPRGNANAAHEQLQQQFQQTGRHAPERDMRGHNVSLDHDVALDDEPPDDEAEEQKGHNAAPCTQAEFRQLAFGVFIVYKHHEDADLPIRFVP